MDLESRELVEPFCVAAGVPFPQTEIGLQP